MIYATGNYWPTNTEYVGQFVHQSCNGTSSLKYIITPEGMLKNKGTNAIPIWEWNYNLTDHLGNVRVVFRPTATNGAEKLGHTNYLPFGLRMPYPYSAWASNYLYNGKELQGDGGLDLYDYGARFYDPAVVRTLTLDPHAENHYSESPYSFLGNNPINSIDPDGMDWYEFDKDGNYNKKTEIEGTNRIVRHTVEKTKDGSEYDSYKFFDFADPENDAKDIDNGTINKLVSVSEKEMQSMLDEQGAYESGKLNFAWESLGGGNFDYSFSKLTKEYPNASFNKKTMKSNSLFLPEGDNTAHNFMNFGNYLWGATGYTVGLGFGELQAGAHLNSKINPNRNGYPSQWDSKDDQRSIIKGAYHAQTQNYRKLRK